MYSGRLIAVAAALFFSSCAAQCPDMAIDGGQGYYEGESCGVDPSDNTDLAILQGICAGANNEPYTLKVTYTANGQRKDSY